MCYNILGDMMNKLAYIFLTFILYSFLGWVVEVIVGYIQQRKLINRGFLIGPLCPIYGVGGLIILLTLGKYDDDPLVLFFMSIMLCAVLEYFTSYLMEKIFKNRWWDYSYMKYNINGRVCLEFACAFGVGGVFVTYISNPLMLKLLDMINLKILNIVAILLAIIFIIDFVISFKIIFKLKNISNSIRSDSTEIITKKVKETLKDKSIFLRRLLDSFPDMQIYNKLAILKERIERDKKELKEEKKKRRSRFFK